MDVTEKLHQLDTNEKMTFLIGGKKYKIGRLCNWTSRKINRLIFKLQKKKLDSVEDVMNSDADRKIVPQVISLAILKTPLKIFLFHWFLWRKLDMTSDQQGYANVISAIINNSDMAFFSNNLTSLHAAAMMETGMTKKTITNIAAELESEQETT